MQFNENGRLLDVPATLTGLAEDEALLCQIAQILLDTAPTQLRSIDAALKEADLKRAFQQAHSLKGAVAVFQAPEVLKSVAAVEQLAKNNEGAAAAAEFAQAQVLVKRLLTELELVVANGAGV